MNIYLAGPLFTLAERSFNERFAEALQRSCGSVEVVLPQKHAAAIAKARNFPQEMLRFSLDAIDRCDAVVAILDGADADSGTCVEIGYAKAKGKTVVGVRTDLRASEDRGVNLMVANICSRLILRPSTSATVGDLAGEVARVLTAKDPSVDKNP